MNNRVKRAIIVGIGGHAHVWKKALDGHPDWELAAIVDTDTDKLEHAPNSWGIDRKEAFTSIEEAIQFGKGAYDLAILVTPTYTHHVLAMESLEVGLNVLSEKNLASSIDQGRQMVKTANENPHLCTAAGTQTRYFPQNWSLKKYYLEHKKELGNITSLNFSYLYNWGKTRQGWRRWLKDLFLEDMAPHHFDLMRYLTDMDIVQVQGATNFKPSFSYFKGSSTTFAIFALSTPENYENPDNWVYATYRGDWQKKGKLQHTVELNYEGGELNLIERKKDKKIEISIFEDAEGFKYHDESVPITSDVEYNKKNYSSELFLLEELSIGIDSKGKIQPKTNYNDAFKSFAVSRGIVESFETGKSVYLPKYWKNLPIQ